MDEHYANISVIVGAFFFFSFLVFFLFDEGVAPAGVAAITGAFALDDNDVSDASYKTNKTLGGPLRVTVAPDDFLPYDYDATLTIENRTEVVVFEKSLDLDEFFAQTSGITSTTDDNGDVGYSVSGSSAQEYLVNLNVFNARLQKPGQYTITLDIAYRRDGDNKHTDTSWQIVIEEPDLCSVDTDCGENNYCTAYSYCAPKVCTADSACSAPTPYCHTPTYSCVACLDSSACSSGLSCSASTHRCRDPAAPEIYEVLFVSSDYHYSFTKGQSVLCATNVSVGDVTLGAEIFKPNDTLSTPTAVFSDAQFTCYPNAPGFCYVTYTPTASAIGQWSCRVSVSNASGSDQAISPKPLLMGNSPPTATKVIPDVNLSSEVVYELFDLDDYFTDTEGDALGFAWRGEHVSVNIGTDHKVGIRGVVGDGATSGWIIFTVTDGYSEVDSNIVDVFFSFTAQGTDAMALSGCVEDWQCGAWSAWQNDARTRVCTDLNACATTFTKPPELQQRTYTGGGAAATNVQEQQLRAIGQQYTGTASSGTSWVWTLMGIGVLILLTIGGVFVVFYLKKKKRKALAATKTAQASAAASAAAKPVVQQISPTKIRDLERYLLASLQKGQTMITLKAQALKAGWPAKTLDDVCKTVDLKQYVDAKLKQGYSVATLKKSLLQKGWKQETIDYVFSWK